MPTSAEADQKGLEAVGCRCEALGAKSSDDAEASWSGDEALVGLNGVSGNPSHGDQPGGTSGNGQGRGNQ